MTTERIETTDLSKAAAIRRKGHAEGLSISGFYMIECRDKYGNVKWRDVIKNLVTTLGRNTLLDTMFGPTAAATWYLGLIDSTGYTTGPAAGDSMASHAGWAESVAYSESARPTAVFAAAAAGEKALTAPAEFSVSVDSTVIKGLFLANNSTKGGATGVLYSAGAFANGDKSVDNGDTLSVTYTARAL